jgi:putative membrane protein
VYASLRLARALVAINQAGGLRSGRAAARKNNGTKGRQGMRLLLVWILNAIALLGVAYLYPGVQVQDWKSAAIAALVLGLVNTLVKPILVLLTLPVTILTLGLFLVVLNALLFWGVAEMLPGFNVNGFWAAVLGAILYSVIGWALSLLIPERK